MHPLIYFSFLIWITSCGNKPTLIEREIISEKISAFNILSDNHDYLHVMMGEYDGNKQEAFDKFNGIIAMEDNSELLPIKKALSRITSVNKDSLLVNRLDALVDYYQSGLSIQIEAIFKGYGHNIPFEGKSALVIYDSLTFKNN
tara:strand:+ start:1130 stop:1561 length:432 start_codon:yes stop_codon:yes gene_type:complete